jgi:hypothetical protein
MSDHLSEEDFQTWLASVTADPTSVVQAPSSQVPTPSSSIENVLRCGVCQAALPSPKQSFKDGPNFGKWYYAVRCFAIHVATAPYLLSFDFVQCSKKECKFFRLAPQAPAGLPPAPGQSMAYVTFP